MFVRIAWTLFYREMRIILAEGVKVRTSLNSAGVCRAGRGGSRRGGACGCVCCGVAATGCRAGSGCGRVQDPGFRHRPPRHGRKWNRAVGSFRFRSRCLILSGLIVAYVNVCSSTSSRRPRAQRVPPGWACPAPPRPAVSRVRASPVYLAGVILTTERVRRVSDECRER